MSHLLIYDADLSGHHQDYLDAVVDFIETRSPLANSISQVSLMLPSAYWQKRDGSSALKFVNRIDIPAKTLEQRNAMSPRRRALLEISFLISVVNENGVNELMLMNLDYFQVALASPLARGLSCQVSGIQLQPYTRSELVAKGPPFAPALWFRALRKRYRLQKMLSNLSMARLCIPADASAVALLNQRHAQRVKAIMLPEPYLRAAIEIDELDKNALPDILARYSLKPENRIILVFGNIIARKNVGNIIRAMRRLHQSGRTDAVLLVVGKASLSYQKKLRELAQQNEITASCVRFDFDFVEDQVLQALFHSADVVAMPYFKTYQSSGILFQAVQYEKPVITANQGLVSELVHQYDLGESVDPESPQQISNAMARLLDSWTSSTKVQSLIDCHSEQNHAAVVLDQPLP